MKQATTARIIILIGIGLILGNISQVWAKPPLRRPQGQQVPLTPQVRYPGVYMTGIYATEGGLEGYENLDKALYKVDGDLLTVNWAYIEDESPDTANWNWVNLDKAFAWAGAKSKVLGLLINTYSSGRGVVGSMPSYLWNPDNPYYVSGALVKTGLPGCTDVYDNPNCVFPRYWSNAYRHAYHRFIRELGRRYGHDPRLEFVAIGIGRDGENYPVDYANQAVKQRFFAEIRNDLATQDLFCEPDCTDPLTVWIAFVKELIDVYHEAFPNKVVLVQLAGSVFPFDQRAIEKKEILDYADRLGVGQSVNNMYPNWLWAYMPQRIGFFDHLPFHGYDFVHNSQKGNPNHTYPVAMEGYFRWVGCEGQNGEIQVYWSLLSALSKHPEYLRMYNDFFVERLPEGGPDWTKPRPNIIRLVEQWKPYLGRTPATAPGVFVALRDHKGPWYECRGNGPPDQRRSPSYPDYGDYSYWLYLNITEPGGRAVPETAFPTIMTWNGAKQAVDFMGDPYQPLYFNDEPYNPNLPQRKETWAIRRTDEHTGNPYMFFAIDEGYLATPADIFTITVTYVDIGNDTFSLYYQAAGTGKDGKRAPLSALYEVTEDDQRYPINITPGTTSVRKENTKQIRQAVFVLQDMDFRRGLRGNADFYIYSNGDGDEWVHMVHVTRGSAPTVPTPTPWPSPTPTATPTLTPTATLTPTPTPSVAAIIGKVFFDVDQDGVLDPDEPGVAGAEVRLFYGGTQLIGTPVITDRTGRFSFTDLPPGFYLLRETDPPGYRSTTVNAYTGVLSPGITKTDWNFGDYTAHGYVPFVLRPR